MTFSFVSVDDARAQLDPVMAAAGWRVSFADHEAVQYCPPVAEDLTNHLQPFVIPSIDWHAGEPLEATDFDAKLHRAANVFDLMAWLARQALDERMSDRRAIVAAHGRRRRARRAAE
jgi:hypothetical protein